MNDQCQIMNQHQVNSRSHVFLTNQSHKMMKQSQMSMNQSNMLNQLQNPGQMANQVNLPKIRHPKMVNQLKSASRGYGQWSQPPHPNVPPLHPIPMNAAVKFAYPMNQMQMSGGIAKPKRSSWKLKKKLMNKRRDVRQNNHQPPTLNELEQQNKLKVRNSYNKKIFNRMSPYAHAPRNTTSYLIRAKKSGGIASMVSPCPVTPAVLPTPVFSPSREALVEMAKEEWGVDGYGSMKGLIRLRSPGYDETMDDYEEEDEEGSSGSGVEERVEVERRLDNDLSRFEMIYPNTKRGVDYHNVLENRVDDQDSHIGRLEEENLILKKRLYMMERELGELQSRLLCRERQDQVVENISEEVVDNVSTNDSERLNMNPLLDSRHDEEVDFVPTSRAEESVWRTYESGNEIVDKDERSKGACNDRELSQWYSGK